MKSWWNASGARSPSMKSCLKAQSSASKGSRDQGKQWDAISPRRDFLTILELQKSMNHEIFDLQRSILLYFLLLISVFFAWTDPIWALNLTKTVFYKDSLNWIFPCNISGQNKESRTLKLTFHNSFSCPRKLKAVIVVKWSWKNINLRKRIWNHFSKLVLLFRL